MMDPQDNDVNDDGKGKHRPAIPDVAHKMYFWNGCLVTRYGEHFVGDIKVKRSYHDIPTKVTLYTSDVPPVSVKENELITAKFYLENSAGLSTLKYKVVEFSMSGEEMSKMAPLPGHANVYVMKKDEAEWHFFLNMNGVYVLYHISVKVPEPQIRAFISV
eukprot:JZ553918.1.p2 GENE.JZ553918.1~~JZ553918.1.p2  ORF type:complete len:160 (+),score=0.15 JZ553918.1:62-541(+)